MKTIRSYYLQTNGGWYLWEGTRWQFLQGCPDETLCILLANDSHVSVLTKLKQEESDMLDAAFRDLHVKHVWTIYHTEEAGKEKEKA